VLNTHYYRIREYLNPDYVHVLLDGKIVKSGDKSLALKLEEKGYSWLE
jgi:Fe-S cluster assembly ATP-binding protein